MARRCGLRRPGTAASSRTCCMATGEASAALPFCRPASSSQLVGLNFLTTVACNSSKHHLLFLPVEFCQVAQVVATYKLSKAVPNMGAAWQVWQGKWGKGGTLTHPDIPKFDASLRWPCTALEMPTISTAYCPPSLQAIPCPLPFGSKSL